MGGRGHMSGDRHHSGCQKQGVGTGIRKHARRRGLHEPMWRAMLTRKQDGHLMSPEQQRPPSRQGEGEAGGQARRIQYL